MREENDYYLGLTTIRDQTTDPLYIFTSVTLNPDAATTASEWVCYRTTVSDGTKKYAVGSSGARVTSFAKPERLLKASLAATYTY